MRPTLHLLSASFVLAVAGAAQAPLDRGITLVDGPAANDLTVRVVDPSSPSNPGSVLLQRVELMPVEVTARTVAQEWDTEHARRIERNGLFRVELPGGGRLFQYRRDGGLWHGFLWVKEDGTAQVLLETAGTGIAGTGSPFVDRIAVRRDGSYAAIPLLAGGLHLVRLDGAVYASTGTVHRFVATQGFVDADSVLVGRSYVFFQNEIGRLWRCPLADGGTPADVTPPPVLGALLEEQMAISGDGTTVAFLYGPRNQETLWLLGEVGGPVQLSPPPSKYEDPGYLPEGSGHPGLMLNDDGSRLFYIDGLVRDELFVLDTTGVLPRVHVTGDPIFQPYIGTYILPSFVSTTLTIAIGDLNRMDWFEVDGTGQVSNLTGTGSLTQPYPAGTLDPQQATRAGSYVLSTELDATGLRLRRVDTGNGRSVVVESALVAEPEPGSALGGAADLLVRTPTGDRYYSGSTAQPLVATPGGILLDPPHRGGPGAGITGTFVHLVSGWGVPVFAVPGGPVLAAPIEQGLRQVVMTQQGAVLNGRTVRYVAPGTWATLSLPPAAVRWVVSGAGG